MKSKGRKRKGKRRLFFSKAVKNHFKTIDMNLYITDLKGRQIEVTDLNKAIWQAGWYKTYQHEPPLESDKEQQHIGQICTRN